MADIPDCVPFWRKPLPDLSEDEWEALCDGCGLCCRLKEEDEVTGEVSYTAIACRLLDIERCNCRDYEHRKELVPECLQLTPDNVSAITWLPSSCAYRLLSEGYELPEWHPLVTCDRGSTHRAGISVKDRVVSEDELKFEI